MRSWCVVSTLLYTLWFSTELASPVFADSLKDTLQAIVTRPGTQLAGARIGVSVVDANTGKVVFDYNGNTKLRAASNAKILTLLAGFDILGPNFRFRTDIFTDRQPKPDTVGNLYLRGRGDPSLGSEHLYDLARQLADRGIKKGHWKHLRGR